MKLITYILIISIGLCISNVFGQVEPHTQQEQPINETTKSDLLATFWQTPLHFVANRGQYAEEMIYYAKSEGALVYCTDQGLTFGFAQGHISLKFSSDRPIKPEARGELEGKVNYFIGNDPTIWRQDIPTFKEIVYRAVYSGIDLVYNGDQRRLKYTFYLQPNSDPEKIQMIYDGIEGLWIDGTTGELVIQTEWGEMRDAAPVAYQEIEGVRKEVEVSFRLIGEERVGFALGDYDPNFMLTIDPGYSTYLGGSDHESGRDIVLDSEGNVYVTGDTQSADFPTENAYDNSHNGSGDVFVISLLSDGTIPSPVIASITIAPSTEIKTWDVAKQMRGEGPHPTPPPIQR